MLATAEGQNGAKGFIMASIGLLFGSSLKPNMRKIVMSCGVKGIPFGFSLGTVANWRSNFIFLVLCMCFLNFSRHNGAESGRNCENMLVLNIKYYETVKLDFLCDFSVHRIKKL